MFYNTPTRIPNSTKRVSASDDLLDNVNLNQNWPNFTSKDVSTERAVQKLSMKGFLLSLDFLFSVCMGGGVNNKIPAFSPKMP